jgi:ParB/RepB/Spo0J family partition protein
MSFWGGRVVIAKRGLARIWRRVGISFLEMKEELCIEEISVSEIGERYGAYRIVSPRADAAMVKSLRHYGQLSPVVCVKGEGGYEMIDGFKRLRACRRLDKTTLRAKTMEVSGRVCKAAIIELNWSGRSINEMEEALVVQSLHREDGLTQSEIGVLVGRDKSWVSRRISLIERLSEEVQEDIRLGLLSVMTGRELAKLPRGNQREAADAILKGRYTTREAAKLIGYLLSRPRWESSVILASPWEVVEPRQPRPRGFGAKLLLFREVCQSVLEGVKKCSPETRRGLSSLIDLAMGSAEEVVKTLRTDR